MRLLRLRPFHRTTRRPGESKDADRLSRGLRLLRVVPTHRARGALGLEDRSVTELALGSAMVVADPLALWSVVRGVSELKTELE